MTRKIERIRKERASHGVSDIPLATICGERCIKKKKKYMKISSGTHAFKRMNDKITIQSCIISHIVAHVVFFDMQYYKLIKYS